MVGELGVRVTRKRSKQRKVFIRELRKRLIAKPHSTLITFAVLTFLVVTGENHVLRGGFNVDRYDLDVAEGDIFIIYIRPVLERVSVDCKPLVRGNPYDLSISTNYTDNFYGETTVIWMKPGAQGKYNLTITFETNEAWDYILGVYSRNVNMSLYGKNAKVYGRFIELQRPYTRTSGNWTINIVLDSHGEPLPAFVINLPTPLNSVLLATVTGLVTYFNIFILLDTYFKNLKETVSNKRWLFCGITMLASALMIYELYIFTVFTLSGGG